MRPLSDDQAVLMIKTGSSVQTLSLVQLMVKPDDGEVGGELKEAVHLLRTGVDTEDACDVDDEPFL